MCGVFGFSVGMSSREFADRLNIDNLPQSWEDFQSYKITPRSRVGTVSRNSPNRFVHRMWWLVPPWADDPYQFKFPTFNARVEGIVEKPAFRHAWKSAQRCLIPASYFIEWETKKVDGEKKQFKLPYLIRRKDKQMFNFAGLYEVWKQDAEGVEIESCTIITVPSGKILGQIHDREPVILSEDDEEKWLSKDTDLDGAYSLLKPLVEDQKEMFRIDEKFNFTKAQDIKEENLYRIEE